jgi:hypothetical protein
VFPWLAAVYDDQRRECFFRRLLRGEGSPLVVLVADANDPISK